MEPLVPVIDIAGWDDGDESVRAAIAADVDEACRTVGFLQIAGHGVDRALIDGMLDASGEFFDLPAERKERWIAPSADVNRGYAPLGSESLTYSLGVDAHPDLFEAFNIGTEDVPEDDPVYAAERHRFFVPNIWPDDTDSLKPGLLAYFDEVNRLARKLCEIFAVALGLPGDFFADKLDHSTETLRVLRYIRAPGSPDPLPGQVRMGAHTDYGIVTVLYGDRVPGLEIVGPDGAWHSVIPEEDVYLVNLGDLLAEWTNDRWRSTVHRVVPPERSQDGPALRRSAAYFLDGNYDALVEVLPTCTSEDNPAKYPPVFAGDHLMAKLLGPRTKTASEATNTAADRLAAL